MLSLHVCLSEALSPIQANGEYPLLNGDWNMGAACLGNHLMSTCQRYQGGTKSKTTGLSNQKRHRGNRFLRNLQAMKRISRGFDRDFIWHRSCLQINPATKLWFPFIPKVPFPWLQCRGSWGGWSEVKQREKGTLRHVILWFGLSGEKSLNLILTASKITFLFNRGFIV